MVLQEFGRDVHSGIQGNSEFSTYYSENVENPESAVNPRGVIVNFGTISHCLRNLGILMRINVNHSLEFCETPGQCGELQRTGIS